MCDPEGEGWGGVWCQDRPCIPVCRIKCVFCELKTLCWSVLVDVGDRGVYSIPFRIWEIPSVHTYC